MGTKQSCFGRFYSAERLPEKEYDTQIVSSSRAISFIAFLKPAWLWKKKDRKMQHKERQEYQQLKTVKEAITLEELFLTSPGKGECCLCTNVGDYYVLKQLSNIVCPSLSEDSADLVTECRDSVSLERLLKMDEVLDNGEMNFSLESRTPSGKEKKRVSFKLPEVSDIIIFYSPEVEYCQD